MLGRFNARVLFAILLVTGAGSAAASDTERGRDIAKAIAELARINGEVDVQYLSHFLKLPDLERDLKWHGPSSESEATNLDASYAPLNSILGINGIALQRRTGAGNVIDGKPAEFHGLLLSLKPGSCPSEATLAEAIGSKPLESQMPGYDGGPSYKTKAFSVPQSGGEPVMVILVGDDTCHVTIGHTRPL